MSLGAPRERGREGGEKGGSKRDWEAGRKGEREEAEGEPLLQQQQHPLQILADSRLVSSEWGAQGLWIQLFGS